MQGESTTLALFQVHAYQMCAIKAALGPKFALSRTTALTFPEVKCQDLPCPRLILLKCAATDAQCTTNALISLMPTAHATLKQTLMVGT